MDPSRNGSHPCIGANSCLLAKQRYLRRLVDEVNFVQLLGYVWCANRYQPNRFIHTALVAFKTGFVTLRYYPDGAIISQKHQYSDHEALVQYVYDLYYPQCGIASTLQPLEFKNLKVIQNSSNESKTDATTLKPTFTYSVQDGDETIEYVMFDIFHGSGFGQQTYVGLGAKPTSDGKSPQVIILKVYCRERARPLREEGILQEIHKEGYMPGVPRICQNTPVELPFVLPTIYEDDPKWEPCMISFATIGESLSMCKDVLQFFKAMYDLTEVEKKHVLHRDVSWGNILINHRHFEGPDDDLRDFHFIENILGEPEPRVQVVLTDFDHAMVIQETKREKDEHDGTESNMEQCGAVGTPAFISEALGRGNLWLIRKHFSFQRVQNPNEDLPAHPLEDRHHSDMDFYKEFTGYDRLDKEEVEHEVSHQAIHDAESIFWNIVFFMIRASPKGSANAKGPDDFKFIRHRSKLFDAMMENDVDNPHSSRRSCGNFSVKNWEDVLAEELKGFAGTLIYTLSRYFFCPWYSIQVPDKHPFHAHNFLQRVLIREIRQLEKAKDPIQLDSVPLPIRSRLMNVMEPTRDFKTRLPFGSQQKRSPETIDSENEEDTLPAKRRKYDSESEQAQAAADNPTGDAHPCTCCIRFKFSIDTAAAAPISYQVPPSIVHDDTVRKVIQDIRTSKDVQKLWFTNKPMPLIIQPWTGD